jgi:TatD DNase family protein
VTGPWFDQHCHLGEEAGAEVDEARSAGVAAMVDVAYDLTSSAAAADRADRFEAVFATVGVHPHEARHGVGGVEDLLDRPGVVAVGECGLDYHYDHSPRPEQRAAFAAQIGWAHRHRLPLVVHTREAWDDTFAILAAEGVPERTVFHCFTGGPAEAERALALGAHLSFSGVISFKSAEDLRAAARTCPLERMLVETDSPYLAPVPHRGRRNRPAWLPLVGEALAAALTRPVEEVRAATWRTTCQLYGVSPPAS